MYGKARPVSLSACIRVLVLCITGLLDVSSLAFAGPAEETSWLSQAGGVGSATDGLEAVRKNYRFLSNEERQRFENAIRAARSGDINAVRSLCVTLGKERIEWCKQAANAGDDSKAFELGREYAFGYHVPVDQVEASRWYLVAAKTGSGIARTLIGERYLYGLGVLQSDKEALYWFQVAGNAHQSSAYFWLGWLTETGRAGVKQDYAKAIDWYQQSFNPGSVTSSKICYRLGLLYAKGLGTAPDADKARYYLSKAETLAIDFSDYYGLYSHAMYGIRAAAVAPDVSEQRRQLELAHDLVRRPGGSAAGEFHLGLAYDGGLGVKSDQAEALDWYKRAAEHGHIPAMFNVGAMYLAGAGVEQDEVQAMRWFERASAAGDIRATYMVGLIKMYPGFRFTRKETKRIASVDRANGLRLIREVAEQGLVEAQRMMAIYYARGEYVERDLQLSEKWWDRMLAQSDEMRRENIDPALFRGETEPVGLTLHAEKRQNQNQKNNDGKNVKNVGQRAILPNIPTASAAVTIRMP